MHEYHPHNHEEYQAYIQSEEWQRTRARFAQHHDKCWVCHTKEHLDTNHLTYHTLGYEGPGDLVRMCHAHHMEFHAMLREAGYPYDRRFTVPLVRLQRKRYLGTRQGGAPWFVRLVKGFFA